MLIFSWCLRVKHDRHTGIMSSSISVSLMLSSAASHSFGFRSITFVGMHSIYSKFTEGEAFLNTCRVPIWKSSTKMWLSYGFFFYLGFASLLASLLVSDQQFLKDFINFIQNLQKR